MLLNSHHESNILREIIWVQDKFEFETTKFKIARFYHHDIVIFPWG